MSSKKTIIRVPFSSLEAGTVTLSSGFQLTQILVTPALNARLVNIADNYALYRFTDINVELLTPGPAGTATAESCVQVLGFMPGTTDTIPTIATQVANCYRSCVTGFHNQIGSESAPTPMRSTPAKLHLTKEDLLGETPNKWWKTVAGSAVELWEEQQGVLFLASDSSASSSSIVGYALMIKGVIEFCAPLATAQTPLAPESRVRARVNVLMERPTRGERVKGIQGA